MADVSELQSAVRNAVAHVTITDVHTHLFPPNHGNLLLWGVDELLTYHYLIAELFTQAPADLTYDKFWQMDKSAQADLIWQRLFIETAPISEARRGVLTAMSALGLNPAGRDLNKLRQWFAEQSVDTYLQKVFELADLDYAVMTNNPLVQQEAAYWQAGEPTPAVLKTALRIDALLLNFTTARAELNRQGATVGAKLDRQTFAALRKWLGDWAGRLNPVYMAASLGPDWTYPANDETTMLLDEVVCPLSAERNLPVALMVGVRKAMNPDLRDAGDGVGRSDISSVVRLCQAHPKTKFLLTTLSRTDQHELAVAGRKFRNLHLFGCWWFLNNPSIIEEMARQRLELLGTNVTIQHSDARVLDQLIYKWSHTREIIAKVLVDKYTDAHNAGWRFAESEITRDVRRLFGGAFEEFLAK
ncbi:MAG: glucuronate isomerase [Planctomycetes bacterium]|nr:glucuronate isomerase [Planctomycetota bacterium]